MGLLSSMAKGFVKSIEKQCTENIIKTTGANIRPELREIDYEIQALERELTYLERDEEKYDRAEYLEIVSDIKHEIRAYRMLKTDLLKSTYEEYKEGRKSAYRAQLEGVSDKRLRQIADNPNAPSILKEVAREMLR